MRRVLLYFSVSFISFALGLLAAKAFSPFSGEKIQVIEERVTLSPLTPSIYQEQSRYELPDFKYPEDNCDDQSETGNYKPLLRSWLRGKQFDERSPYCSGTTKIATSFNGTNIHPSYIDLNSDGKNELAIRTNCGMTGNCDMDIFEKVTNKPRKIFTAVHGVQIFGKQGRKHFGYFDVWAKMHGSANTGDMVVYRYDGTKYRPVACYKYEYDANDNANTKPTLTPFSCQNYR